MQLPNVKHPKVFVISEVRIELITYFALSDQQAAALAMHSWQTSKKVRAAKGKLVTIPWLGDQATLALLSGR